MAGRGEFDAVRDRQWIGVIVKHRVKVQPQKYIAIDGRWRFAPAAISRLVTLDLVMALRRKTASKSASKRDYSTPALEKGLDILELFASTPGGLTVSEVARMLNRTVSEIFRMLLCLEQRGYLSQSKNREKYHLTLRIFRLAQEHLPSGW
jgi:DNA-binding MarR family transcriptional regulator